jgi:pilus assembly protein Flp/PilA
MCDDSPVLPRLFYKARLFLPGNGCRGRPFVVGFLSAGTREHAHNGLQKHLTNTAYRVPFMVWLTEKVVHFLKAEDGPAAVEYAMMLTLIILVCISAVVSFGQATDASFRHSRQEITNAFQPQP